MSFLGLSSVLLGVEALGFSEVFYAGFEVFEAAG
jgi:hypothetical protein